MTKLDFHHFQVRHFNNVFEQSWCHCRVGATPASRSNCLQSRRIHHQVKYRRLNANTCIVAAILFSGHPYIGRHYRASLIIILQLQIDKADVQKHHDVDKSRWDDVLAPCCNIQLQWIGPKNAAVTDLQHAVAIKGTTVPGNFFTISYYPSKEGDDEQEIITEPQILVRHFLMSVYTCACMFQQSYMLTIF